MDNSELMNLVFSGVRLAYARGELAWADMLGFTIGQLNMAGLEVVYPGSVTLVRGKVLFSGWIIRRRQDVEADHRQPE